MLASVATPARFFASNLTVSIEPPLEAISPNIVLNAPTTIGACDRLVLDARATLGSGGRPLETVMGSRAFVLAAVPI